MSAEHLTGYDPSRQNEVKEAVFGKSRNKSRNPLHAIGLTSGGDGRGLLGFRRTDADRKPARVVIRPNDGPGSMERRYQLSEERKAAVARKAIHYRSDSETYRQAQDYITAENRRLILGAMVNRSPMTMAEISEETGIDIGAVSIFVARMCDDGLTSKRRSGNTKSPVIAQPTVKGLEWLEANQ